MRSASQTAVRTSEPAGLAPIIDTGARASLSNVEALVRESWKSRNLYKPHPHRPRHDVFGCDISRCACTRSRRAFAWLARPPMPPKSRTHSPRVRALSTTCCAAMFADCGRLAIIRRAAVRVWLLAQGRVGEPTLGPRVILAAVLRPRRVRWWRTLGGQVGGAGASGGPLH